MKKWSFAIVVLTILFATGCDSHEEEPEIPVEKGELSLFDQDKKPVAYIDYDDDATIYLWEGTPVAYLVLDKKDKSTDGVTDICGFNGEFLGWYYDGVVYDREGYAVGAKKGITRGSIYTTVVHIESVKGVKHVKPIKYVRHIAARNTLVDSWSETTLTDFLQKGIR